MNRQFAVIITIASVFLVGLLIALTAFRTRPSTEDVPNQIAYPTNVPNNRTFSNTSTIKSNNEVQIDPIETSAIENTVKKLPIDTSEFKVEYSEMLDTFYIQSVSTDEAKLTQFLEENKLASLYKSHPKFFKLTKKNPKYVLDEDEFVFINENGLGESVPDPTPTPNPNDPSRDIKPVLNTFKTLMGFNSVLAPLSTTTTSRQPVRQSTQRPARAPATGSSPGAPINTSNCANIVGNERIVCSALKYTGIRYGYASDTRGNNLSKERWGVISQGRNGHQPATWIAQRIPGGANDFLECSGYTAVAIYDAFGVVADPGCSVFYLSAANFKKIDINTARAGDLLIKGTGCATAGGGGHIGIFVKRLANGGIQTLESTSRGSGRTGYYEVGPTYFTRAVRYTGPGSTP